jgi:hypothetical protein
MSQEPRTMVAPKPLVIIASVIFVFSFGITVRLLFFSDKTDVLREQTIYWFAIAVIAAVLPWIRQFKWKDIEFKLADIENKIEWIANRRYANLIYLIDNTENLAVVYHRQYSLWIPCGSRLEPYEMPHVAVHRAVSDELGLDPSRYEFWPEHKTLKYGNTEIVPRPYQVQLEKGDHRGEVPFHYDFVYVCRAYGEKPPLSGKEKSRWVSIGDLEDEIKKAGVNERVTFPDVIPTFQKILQEMSRNSLSHT